MMKDDDDNECALAAAASSKSEEECSSTSADTDIKLFLAPDVGLQTCDHFFQVSGSIMGPGQDISNSAMG